MALTVADNNSGGAEGRWGTSTFLPAVPCIMCEFNMDCDQADAMPVLGTMYFEPPSDARVTLYVVIHAETSFQAVCIREDEENTSRMNGAVRGIRCNEM